MFYFQLNSFYQNNNAKSATKSTINQNAIINRDLLLLSSGVFATELLEVVTSLFQIMEI